jgi:transposase
MRSERVDEPALEIQSVRTYQIGALPVLYPILEALQVGRIVNEVAQTQATIDLGRVVVLLTLNRLMQAKPLSQVGRWLAGTVLAEVVAIEIEQIYDMRLGRALDQLYPFLGEVWARLVCQAIEVYNLDLEVLHWDITSLYFEGAYRGSELAQYGYSRDHRPDTKQVNLEVDVSHDSAATILYQVLAGNTADITRPVAHLRGLLDFLARPELQSRHFRPILVSDSKMITPDAVFACHQHHLF